MHTFNSLPSWLAFRSSSCKSVGEDLSKSTSPRAADQCVAVCSYNVVVTEILMTFSFQGSSGDSSR